MNPLSEPSGTSTHEIEVSLTDVVTSESGDGGVVLVTLDSVVPNPSVSHSFVRLSATSSNTNEIELSGVLGYSATSPTSFPLFLSGIDDFAVDGNQTVTITIALDSTTDPDFLNLQPVTFNAINLDNDAIPVPLSIGSYLVFGILFLSFVFRKQLRNRARCL